VGAIVEIGLNFLLLPRVGWIGAGFAFMAGFFTTFVVAFYFAQKHYGFVYETKRILQIISIWIPLFAAGIAIMFLVPSIPVGLLSKLALLGIFAGLILLLRIVQLNEILKFIKTFRHKRAV
jgi:O-antigen/teichoic acid export membrane protein